MFTLIKQGINFQLRDKNWLIFNIVFPIALLLMTSYFMKNNFQTDGMNLDTVKIGICNETSDTIYFDAIRNLESDVDFEIKEIETVNDGKELIKCGELQVLLIQKDEEVDVYSGDENYIENVYVTAVIENIESGIASGKVAINYRPVENYISAQYIETSFSSSDYYGVVIITMMVLYVIIVPLCLFSYDFDNQIVQRVCMTGVKRVHYFIARIISSVIIELIIIIPIFLFSVFVLRTNWGSHLLWVIISMLLTIIMAVMLGTVLYMELQSYEKCLLIVQTIIIPVWSFLGGSYIKLNTNNPIINAVLWLSPLRWLNQGIFRSVYVNNNGILIKYSLIAGVAIVLLGVILVLRSGRRKEQ